MQGDAESPSIVYNKPTVVHHQSEAGYFKKDHQSPSCLKVRRQNSSKRVLLNQANKSDF